jgi:hypothetical protein
VGNSGDKRERDNFSFLKEQERFSVESSRKMAYYSCYKWRMLSQSRKSYVFQAGVKLSIPDLLKASLLLTKLAKHQKPQHKKTHSEDEA